VKIWLLGNQEKRINLLKLFFNSFKAARKIWFVNYCQELELSWATIQSFTVFLPNDRVSVLRNIIEKTKADKYHTCHKKYYWKEPDIITMRKRRKNCIALEKRALIQSWITWRKRLRWTFPFYHTFGQVDKRETISRLTILSYGILVIN